MKRPVDFELSRDETISIGLDQRKSSKGNYHDLRLKKARNSNALNFISFTPRSPRSERLTSAGKNFVSKVLSHSARSRYSYCTYERTTDFSCHGYRHSRPIVFGFSRAESLGQKRKNHAGAQGSWFNLGACGYFCFDSHSSLHLGSNFYLGFADRLFLDRRPRASDLGGQRNLPKLSQRI